MPGGRGTAHLVQKCKGCGRTNSVDIVDGSEASYKECVAEPSRFRETACVRDRAECHSRCGCGLCLVRVLCALCCVCVCVEDRESSGEFAPVLGLECRGVLPVEFAFVVRT